METKNLISGRMKRYSAVRNTTHNKTQVGVRHRRAQSYRTHESRQTISSGRHQQMVGQNCHHRSVGSFCVDLCFVFSPNTKYLVCFRYSCQELCFLTLCYLIRILFGSCYWIGCRFFRSGRLFTFSVSLDLISLVLLASVCLASLVRYYFPLGRAV